MFIWGGGGIIPWFLGGLLILGGYIVGGGIFIFGGLFIEGGFAKLLFNLGLGGKGIFLSSLTEPDLTDYVVFFGGNGIGLLNCF